VCELSKFGLGLDEEAAQAQRDISLGRTLEVVAVGVDRRLEGEAGVAGREAHAAPRCAAMRMRMSADRSKPRRPAARLILSRARAGTLSRKRHCLTVS